MRALLLLLLACLSGCAESHPIRDVALRLEFQGGGICSGTAVSRDVILSAEHCFESGRLVAINGRPVAALKMVKDGKDHVLVRVNTRFRKWARIGRSPATGDRLRWIGKPAGLENIYREGYVARAQTDAILVDAHGFAGDSGSGLMDRNGNVVAVLTGAQQWSRGSWQFQLTLCLPLAFTPEQMREMV